MYVVPPEDVRKEGKIWKLVKPLYGLDDASRKFWLNVRENLIRLKMQTVPGDAAFYYDNNEGRLRGAVLSHMDDFTVAGDEQFVMEIVQAVKDAFTVSKIEEDKFRFTGLDIKLGE